MHVYFAYICYMYATCMINIFIWFVMCKGVHAYGLPVLMQMSCFLFVHVVYSNSAMKGIAIHASKKERVKL